MTNKILKIAIPLALAVVLSISIFVFADPGSSLNRAVQNQDKTLLVDGNMEATGTTAWTALTSVLSKEPTSPEHGGGAQSLRIAYNGTAEGGARQVVFTAKTYRATGWARGDGTAIPKLLETTGSVYWTGTASTSWQYFDVTFTKTSASLYLYSTNLSLGHYVEFDNISVTLYNKNIQNQDKTLLVDGNMEASGTSAWTAINSATLTKITNNGTQNDGSSQALQIAYNGVSGPGVSQAVLTTGKQYRIRGRAHGNGALAPFIGGASTIWVGSPSTDWQNFDVIFTASGINLSLKMQNTGTAVFDDVSLTLYNGNIQNQEKTLLVDGNMEASGVTSWVTSGTATSTKETDNPKNDGKQWLKLSRNGAGWGRSSSAIQTIGKKYRVRGYFKSDGVNIASVSDGGSSALVQSTASTDWQYFDFIFTAQTANFQIGSVFTTAGYVGFDNLTVTLVN